MCHGAWSAWRGVLDWAAMAHHLRLLQRHVSEAVRARLVPKALEIVAGLRQPRTMSAGETAVHAFDVLQKWMIVNAVCTFVGFWSTSVHQPKSGGDARASGTFVATPNNLQLLREFGQRVPLDDVVVYFAFVLPNITHEVSSASRCAWPARETCLSCRVGDGRVAHPDNWAAQQQTCGQVFTDVCVLELVASGLRGRPRDEQTRLAQSPFAQEHVRRLCPALIPPWAHTLYCRGDLSAGVELLDSTRRTTNLLIADGGEASSSFAHDAVSGEMCAVCRKSTMEVRCRRSRRMEELRASPAWTPGLAWGGVSGRGKFDNSFVGPLLCHQRQSVPTPMWDVFWDVVCVFLRGAADDIKE